MSKRVFQLIRAGEQAFEFEVMIYGGTLGDRRPLLIFHSRHKVKEMVTKELLLVVNGPLTDFVKLELVSQKSRR